MSWLHFSGAIALFMARHDDIKRILTKNLVYPIVTDFFVTLGLWVLTHLLTTPTTF